MIPAHALFCKVANTKFKDDHTIDEVIRRCITDEDYRDSQQFTFRFPRFKALFNNPDELEVKHDRLVSRGYPLLIGYRYRFEPGNYNENEEYKKFVNDAVLYHLTLTKKIKQSKCKKTCTAIMDYDKMR